MGLIYRYKKSILFELYRNNNFVNYFSLSPHFAAYSESCGENVFF